ncbi:MAG: UDP-N-acetylmuramoyl-L-alanine--D-glutamate ligase [Jatrophihabitantaceae bacterium]
MRLTELAGKAVVVWGYGREGRAAVLALDGVAVKSLAVVDDQGADGALSGADADAALAAADVVVKSPGISRYDARVVALQQAGVRITGGSALWMAAHHDQTVAVTGSKGKSTTATLIHHLARAVGIENSLGGNMGLPLLDLEPAERYVVELSSYQCSELTASPQIAVLTSLFPEHLNWHGSAERYFADKLNLVEHDPNTVVFNALDPTLTLAVAATPTRARSVPVGGPDGPHLSESAFAVGSAELFDRSVSPLRGEHNAINVCLALAAVQALGVDLFSHRDELATGLGSFEPLPHRLGVVPDPAGRLTFVDDSLSTAPQAAVAALSAFPDGSLCLIVGGQDRGVDYAPLHDHLAAAERPVTVIGIPDSGPRILSALDGLPNVHGVLVADLDEAVALARRSLPSGGTVLLSPAAPSYGIYRDFQARSAAFVAAIAATA